MTRVTVQSPTGGGYFNWAADALDHNSSVTYGETFYRMTGAEGGRVVYRGVFDIDAFGNFVGGTATRIDIYDAQGALTATVDQVDFPSDQFVDLRFATGLFSRLGAATYYGNDGSDYFYGSPQGDTIYGGAGRDSFQSNDGADQLFGESGDDFLQINNNGDFADGGADTDRVAIFSNNNVVVRLDTQQPQEIFAGVMVTIRNVEDVYTGAGADDITGSRFNNELDGGLGLDTLRGGLGDDTYILRDVTEFDLGNGVMVRYFDFVEEIPGAGTDTVVVTAGKGRNSYTLGSNLENLEADSTSNDDTGYVLTGNTLDNRITGDRGADTLNGGDGDDTLFGFYGADSLVGGVGDDVYMIADPQAKIVEKSEAGIDRVETYVSFSLAGQFVENLTLLSWGGASSGTGNSLKNHIIGNEFANRLDGAQGDDTLQGGFGDDIYVVDKATDKVIEKVGEGYDSIEASLSFSLAGLQVEKLTLTGNGGFSAGGNSLANTLVGNSGANVIDGLGGGDRLRGNGGADRFVFSTAFSPGNVDEIIDFKHVDDFIVLENAVFQGLTAGAAFTASMLRIAGGASVATTAAQRIVYDTQSGSLFFDRDGSNTTYSAVKFATLTGAPTIDHTDFVVI